MNKDDLKQLKQIIKTLEPYEVIDIRLVDNKKGKIAITRKITKRHVIETSDE